MGMVFLFEWDDSHLHRFELPLKDEDDTNLGGMDPSNPLYLIMSQMRKNDFLWVSNPLSFLRDGMKEERDEEEVTLSYAFKAESDAIQYEYDFGDSWRVQIYCVGVKRKTVRKSQFIPSVRVVGGRGPTIPEYGQSGGTPYKKKELNRTLEGMEEFIYYPWNSSNQHQVEEHGEEEEAEEEEEEGEEDSDLEYLSPRRSRNNNTSVLGKRRQIDEEDGLRRKRQRY